MRLAPGAAILAAARRGFSMGTASGDTRAAIILSGVCW
jgi:hypothetical protein